MELTTDSAVEGFRLSPQQRSLWSLQQTTQGQPFRAFSVIRIEGDLSAPLLRQAVEQLVERHEILRTTFVRPPGIKNPFQVIAEAPQFSWSFVDLSNVEVLPQELQSHLDRVSTGSGSDLVSDQRAKLRCLDQVATAPCTDPIQQ